LLTDFVFIDALSCGWFERNFRGLFNSALA
jgi:hypothetical protein